MKIRNKIMAGIFIIIILASIVIAGKAYMGRRPDITKDIPEQAKELMKKEYNAGGYEVENCWWVDECYFCNIKIGKLDVKRAITCNWEEDKKIKEISYENGTKQVKVIGNYTLEDYIDFDVIEIAKKHYEHSEETKQEDDKNVGRKKSWEKK